MDRLIDWLRRTVWPSVLAGWIGALLIGLAVLLASTAGRQSLRRLQEPLPLWVLVLVNGSLALAWWGIERRFARKMPVVVLISAFSKRQFFASLVSELATELGMRGMEPVIRTPPHRGNSPHHQLHQLKQLGSNRRRYPAAVVVPVKTEMNDDLRWFVNHFKRPVVFLDVQPFLTEGDYPGNSAFVGIDNRAGGSLAAEAMAHALENPDPTVLVLASMLQSARQEGFYERLKALMPNVEIIESEEGAFDRDEAHKVVREHLLKAADEDRAIDGIFATNDEMAIGTVRALRESHMCCPRVLGQWFDGIRFYAAASSPRRSRRTWAGLR